MSTGIKAGLKSITSDLIKQGLKRFLPKVGESTLALSNIMAKKGLPANITQKFVDTALSKLSGIDQQKVSDDIASLAIDEGHALLKKGASAVVDKISEKHPRFRTEFLLPLKKKFREVKARFEQPDKQRIIRVDEDNPRLKNDFSNMKVKPKILESAVSHNNPIIPAPIIPPNTGPMFTSPHKWSIQDPLMQHKKKKKDYKPLPTPSKKPQKEPEMSKPKKISEERVPKRPELIYAGKAPKQISLMTVVEMRNYAKDLGIKNYTRMPKKMLESKIISQLRSNKRKFKSAI